MALSLQVLKTGTPFKIIARELGAVKSIFLISEVLRNYCGQFNVSKNMTPDQIEDYAAEMYLDFKDRNGNSVMLEEIIIVFDRAAKGGFSDPKTGKKIVPFDRIDRTLLDQILDVYFEVDRTQAIHAIEDQLNDKRRTPADDDAKRLEGATFPEGTTIGDIYTTLAGQPDKMRLAKLLNEMEVKYGQQSENQGGDHGQK